nr:MAG TPA: hypothetical protein [Caudoviricetes sp.]
MNICCFHKYFFIKGVSRLFGIPNFFTNCIQNMFVFLPKMFCNL